MVRNEFIKLLTDNGIATLKEVRRLTMNKDSDEVTEFELLDMPHFDENKFALEPTVIFHWCNNQSGSKQSKVIRYVLIHC